MPTPAAAPYVLDPAYQPTDEDTQLIDSICAHVREHPKLYESAVRELDRGKFSFKSLAADRVDFEAAAKKDDARAKKVARKKDQSTHRSWLKQNAPDPRRAIDWRDMRRRRPEVVDLLRINAVRDELLMDWSGMPGSWRGPASAKRLAISTLESQVIFVMTSVLFDPDDHDGKARASLQRVPWNGPPLAGRRGAQRVMSGRGELKIWIEMARRAARKCELPLLGEVSADSGRPAEAPEVVNDSAAARDQDFERIRTRLPQPDLAERAIDALKNLRQFDGDWLAACQIEQAGLSPKTVYTAALRCGWAKTNDVLGHGTASKSYSRARLMRFVVDTWTPRVPATAR